MRRFSILIAASLALAGVHVFASRHWGLFFPLPLVGSHTMIWTWLTANGLVQSFILVFGVAHIFGIAREQTTFGRMSPLWTLTYVVLLGGVVLAWLPGFTHLHR